MHGYLSVTILIFSLGVVSQACVLLINNRITPYNEPIQMTLYAQNPAKTHKAIEGRFETISTNNLSSSILIPLL